MNYQFGAEVFPPTWVAMANNQNVIWFPLTLSASSLLAHREWDGCSFLVDPGFLTNLVWFSSVSTVSWYEFCHSSSKSNTFLNMTSSSLMSKALKDVILYLTGKCLLAAVWEEKYFLLSGTASPEFLGMQLQSLRLHRASSVKEVMCPEAVLSFAGHSALSSESQDQNPSQCWASPYLQPLFHRDPLQDSQHSRKCERPPGLSSYISKQPVPLFLLFSCI